MNLDRSSQSDVPLINHTDPLPWRPEPEGRWGEPYQSADGISWVCSLRRPLTRSQKLAGLSSTVIARDRVELARLMEYEDGKAESRSGITVPAPRPPITR